MRIRQVRVARRDGGELQIELHPALTILTGLGEEGRETVGDLLAAVIYGEVADLAGSLDLEGRSVPLDDWSGVVGDQLDDFDVFIRSEDLPGATSDGGGPQSSGRRETTPAWPNRRSRSPSWIWSPLGRRGSWPMRRRRPDPGRRPPPPSAWRLPKERSGPPRPAGPGRHQTPDRRPAGPGAADKRLDSAAAECEVPALAEMTAGQSVVQAAEAARAEAQRLAGVARAAQDGARSASRAADEAAQRQAERDRVSEQLETRRAGSRTPGGGRPPGLRYRRPRRSPRPRRRWRPRCGPLRRRGSRSARRPRPRPGPGRG